MRVSGPTLMETGGEEIPEILGPRTEGSLNAREVSGDGGCKRKRVAPEDEDEGEVESQLGGPFMVEPYPTSSRARTRLQPVLLVSRLQVPLLFLDTVNCTGATDSRLFRGYIQVLQAPNTPSVQPYNCVLIARHSGTTKLAAIEMVRQGIYSLCDLQSWVTLADFRHGPAKVRRPLERVEAPSQLGKGEWWKQAAVKYEEKSETSAKDSNARTPPRLRFFMKHAGSETVSQKPQIAAVLANLEDDITPSTISHTSNLQDPEVTTQESSTKNVLGLIRNQYLEALYVTRTSLAYYAKGPLSRARAALSADKGAALNLDDLLEFLRSSIMSVNMGNKKYTQTLPELIRDIPAGTIVDEGENNIGSPLRDRMRKSKKRKKTSKGGLCPGEEEYVIQWWIRMEESSNSAGPDETREQRIKSSLVEQRARETQLQIILILEVLSLETITATQATSNQDNLGENAESGFKAQPNKEAKKHQSLINNLDVLVDRLCIWESMNLDKLTSTSKIIHNKSKKGASQETGKGILRDFCTEVIIPFYATRLPEFYASICQKFGSSVPISPKPVAKTSLPMKKLVRPGTAVQRVAPKQSRRPLERVSTEDRGPKKRLTPKLTRSATDSALPSMKRELSAVSLSTVPKHRPSLQESRRYTQREVDLTAVSQATEAKLQKKAAAEQELKNAIATLRKPNARMAVKDLVDSAERRSAILSSKSRKSRNPVHNPFATGVQVMATPKGNRHHDLQSTKSLHPTQQSHYQQKPELELIPPSSDPRVPSSSHRPVPPRPSTHILPAGNSLTPKKSFPTNLRLFPAVQATPTRRASKLGVPAFALPAAFYANGSAKDNREDYEEDLTRASPELPQLKQQMRDGKRAGLLQQVPQRATMFSGRTRARGKTDQSSEISARTPQKFLGTVSFALEHEPGEVIGDTPMKPLESCDRCLTGEAKKNNLESTEHKICTNVFTKEGAYPIESHDENDGKQLPTPAAEISAACDNVTGAGHQGLARHVGENGEQEDEPDIYAALGWDDEGDDFV